MVDPLYSINESLGQNLEMMLDCRHNYWCPLGLCNGQLSQKGLHNSHSLSVVCEVNVADHLLLCDNIDNLKVQSSSRNIDPTHISVREELEMKVAH